MTHFIETSPTIDDFFGQDSVLKMHLKGFEERTEQQMMAHDVEESFKKEKIALIEAGTGIGKSLAYLIPAILWAQDNDERIVISTNTIALQEQLIEKDIPLALKVTETHLKACLVKGMGNYVCLRKLTDALNTGSLFATDEQEELSRIDTWVRNSTTGSKSDMPFFPSYAGWEKVQVEADACSHSGCPRFNECYLFKARREAQESKILIVNHHLLFADLAIKREFENTSTPAILPPYTRLIIDEAHHIEDVAQEYFAERVSRFGLMKVLGQLSLERGDLVFSKMGILHQKILSLVNKDPLGRSKDELLLLQKIEQDLVHARRDALQQVQHTFDTLSSFLTLFPQVRDEEETTFGSQNIKLRLKPAHFAHPFWQKTIAPLIENLSKSLIHLSSIIYAIDKSISESSSNKIDESTKSIRVDIKAHQLRLETMANRLARYIKLEDQTDKIYWVEHYATNGHAEIELVFAEQDISQLLQESLFGRTKTNILCSATLATHKSFEFVKSRIGLNGKKDTNSLIERIYNSPFDYKKNALLGVPTDFPSPETPQFFQAVKEAIIPLIEASQGNAFVLFTSYGMLKSCHQSVKDELTKRGYHILRQGEESRSTLVRKFKEKNRSVLFGTDSFWEGIDIVGDALRCVIITKLPFHVPTEPLLEARCEALLKNGKNPFMEYSVPRAVVKFKQAFGRLIRHKNDRGTVICLDSRLLKKSYGKIFLQSLPGCTESFVPMSELTEKMRTFYNKSTPSSKIFY